MLVISIKLHSAITGKISTLEEMVIFNDETGTGDNGNYTALLHPEEINFEKGVFDGVSRETQIKNHPRLDAPVWNLLAKALKGFGYDKE